MLITPTVVVPDIKFGLSLVSEIERINYLYRSDNLVLAGHMALAMHFSARGLTAELEDLEGLCDQSIDFVTRSAILESDLDAGLLSCGYGIVGTEIYPESYGICEVRLIAFQSRREIRIRREDLDPALVDNVTPRWSRMSIPTLCPEMLYLIMLRTLYIDICSTKELSDKSVLYAGLLRNLIDRSRMDVVCGTDQDWKSWESVILDGLVEDDRQK